ncbi:MAG: hypothetical protein ACR2QM_10075, partial [Longimicrobiales bacterium]
GGEAVPVCYKVVLDAWDGQSGVVEGLPIPSFQRDLFQIQPSLSYGVGPGQVEVGARFTTSGKNLPAGTTLLLQYFTSLSLF